MRLRDVAFAEPIAHEMIRNLLLGFIALALVACGQNEGSKTVGPQFAAKAPLADKEYVFAIHPLHNPVRLFEIYGPLTDYLDRSIPGITFRLEASRNYEEFEKKLHARQFDFALPNPYQTLNSLGQGYHVIAKMGDDDKFTGVILVRRDSGIKKISDLKGKKVAYPARTALAATMMPQYYLQTHGLDVKRDIENLYVGSQESSIMNVYLGNVAAGATWPLPWEAFQQEHPDMARELELKWETEPMINNGVVARDDVPEQLARRVAQLLDTLHTTAEGKAMLARMPLSRFELADDQRYRVIEDFLHKFSQTVYPLDEPRK
ncbi:MAG: phosphate/phosphite/phosphonate ABC transporter substrate-binding protein [Giesbergeria sp.]|nr:phosphate/phosphite/phosphonate ABC transporter substrate-binding protein [Giesbergeria sp.]